MNTYRNQIRAWVKENNRIYELKGSKTAEFKEHLLLEPKFIGPKPAPNVCIMTKFNTDHICTEYCLEI